MAEPCLVKAIDLFCELEHQLNCTGGAPPPQHIHPQDALAARKRQKLLNLGHSQGGGAPPPQHGHSQDAPLPTTPLPTPPPQHIYHPNIATPRVVVHRMRLKTDQEVVVGSCPAGTVLWLFHNSILDEIEEWCTTTPT
ncbi:hypothetical protein B0T24DRAFT_685604 [Lasiosphaeria ovina]|uniref:Uncharacterized protein n=1 Tax=Lasiosphaeria ovina TaxID=92902 RepID=A0AAE0JRM1_9PEZI|nr:hypothetical protein B0T24DRAFT_685604 [Lasiosphaeria ovina]